MAYVSFNINNEKFINLDFTTKQINIITNYGETTHCFTNATKEKYLHWCKKDKLFDIFNDIIMKHRIKKPTFIELTMSSRFTTKRVIINEHNYMIPLSQLE